MGGDSKDREGTERIPTWGGEATHWETSAEKEGRGMALPLTRGGHERGGTNGYQDFNTEKAEHDRAVHCDAIASGSVRGGKSERGSKGAAMVVGAGGNRLGKGEAKGEETDITDGPETGTDTEGEEEWGDESRASGSSGAERSGAIADEWT